MDPEAPVCIGATINENGTTIELSFNKPMKGLTASQREQFGVLVNGYVNVVNAAQLKAEDNSMILLTLDTPVGKNNRVHVSYIKGTIQSADEMYLESFQNKCVDTAAIAALYVMKDINWNYHVIQDAIDEAEDGDTIVVFPGEYKRRREGGHGTLRRRRQLGLCRTCKTRHRRPAGPHLCGYGPDAQGREWAHL